MTDPDNASAKPQSATAHDAELEKGYDPEKVEPRWYAFWLERGVFTASDEPAPGKPTYVLPMPPPNVTGSLHMGHALMCTLEDILVRYHRMCGFETLYQPGMDHAGIATQTVVERQLKQEGSSRHDLGREKFIERVWEWKKKSGGRILDQQHVLGVGADWERTKFTMDPDMSRAVTEAFVRLYREGLIYRGTRLIYWDCEAHTVLSNLEVENEPAQGEMFEFAYPIGEADGGGEIVVATTRPETMLGDTAVAVHPKDPRFSHLHGKFVEHPFIDRKIPIITDAELVDMEFGTGAVKVTPAHDFNDHATGKRHDLEEISILTQEGKMNDLCGQFAGMDRFEARKAVKRALEEKGLARGTKQHDLVLPRSQRNGSVVEPMISTQWFVKTKPLAGPALAAVREKKTLIIPEEWTKTYEHWMTNILDWCISRQLWWGHRIPAYFCDDCEHITVSSAEKVGECEGCKSTKVRQDEDVLDTWFSSALWPFSTVGWPDETPALSKFYPASDLETGYDILFFWVARMMMMGIHFMGEPPFRRILLHAMVVDETGDKMSKVKGNVIDPLDIVHGAKFEDVVHKTMPGAAPADAMKKFKKAYPSAAQMGEGFPAYGADALRMTLASYSPQSKRIPLSLKKIEGYRFFCNKIWNATRFAMTYLEGAKVTAETPPATSLANRWLLSRLATVVTAARTGTDEFRLDDVTSAIYRFFWNDLCDWYLELSKPVFGTSKERGAPDPAAADEARTVLAYALEAVLRLMHPLIPYITEELWQRVPRPEGHPESIALSEYPGEGTGRADADADRDMATLQAIIGAARSIRSEHEVHPGAEVPLTLRTRDTHKTNLLERERTSLRTLIKTKGDPEIGPPGGSRPPGAVMSVAAETEVLVGLKGLVDGKKERERIEREIKRTDKDINVLSKKLSNPKFSEKAPADVVEESRRQLAELEHKRVGLDEAIALADELDG